MGVHVVRGSVIDNLIHCKKYERFSEIPKDTVVRIWTKSLYTSIISDPSGNLLLHNSFMGSIARVSPAHTAHVKQISENSFDETYFENPLVRELCEGGFFVPDDIDEASIVSEILERERNLSFHAIILPHENCNFRCTYCYERFQRGRMSAETVESLKIFIHEKTRQHPRLMVSWFGGEPLLAKKIIFDLSNSFLASCESNGCTYNSAITTNGYFLDLDTARTFLAKNVLRFQVTVDGPKRIHDQSRKLMRGGPTYEKILSNLKDMKTLDTEFIMRIRVNFRVEHTEDVLAEFIDEMTSTFGDDDRYFLSFHPVGRSGGPNDAELDVVGPDEGSRVTHCAMTMAIGNGFSDRVAKEPLRPHGAACYAGRDSSITIGADGTAYKCTVALDVTENRVGRLLPNGELDVDTDLWKRWTSSENLKHADCVACRHEPSCQGRHCPLITIQRGRSPCPFSRKVYEQRVKLAAGAGC